MLETFKQSIDLNGIIGESFTLEKGANSLYSAEQTLDFLIDSTALGNSRFEHIEALRFDPGYKDVKGIDRFPSEKVFSNFFSIFDDFSAMEIRFFMHMASFREGLYFANWGIMRAARMPIMAIGIISSTLELKPWSFNLNVTRFIFK